MKSKFATTILLSIVIIGLALPAAIGVLIGLTPNIPVASADAGQFVSANASAGGFFSLGVTTVQTTKGSITVYGQLSVERGRPLLVQETLKDGLRLCVQETPPTCAGIAGKWAGKMEPVGHTRHMFAPLATHIGADGVAIWIFWGILATVVAGLMGVKTSDPKEAGDLVAEQSDEV